MKPIIRQMNSGDKPLIMHILKLLPEFEPEELEVAEEVIDSYLNDASNSGYYIYVAELAAQLIGYICFGPVPLTKGTWDIYWIAVAPDEQARGVGRTLLQTAEEYIRNDRGRLICIETSSKPNYLKTRRFYKARGYILSCRIADFYARGDDKIVFEKRFG